MRFTYLCHKRPHPVDSGHPRIPVHRCRRSHCRGRYTIRRFDKGSISTRRGSPRSWVLKCIYSVLWLKKWWDWNGWVNTNKKIEWLRVGMALGNIYLYVWKWGKEAYKKNEFILRSDNDNRFHKPLMQCQWEFWEMACWQAIAFEWGRKLC